MIIQFCYSHFGNSDLRSLSPRKSPIQARSAATVDAIFEATIQVLLSHGLSALTTTRIAERAGVSIGTLYQYFPNKDALLRAVITSYLGKVAASFEESCSAARGACLLEISEFIVRGYIFAKCDQPERSRALYAISSHLEVADVVEKVFARLRAAACRLLESCKDASFKNADEVAYSLLAALTGGTRVVFENRDAEGRLPAFTQQMLTMSQAFLNKSASQNATI